MLNLRIITWICCGLLTVSGCSTPRQIARNLQPETSSAPATADARLSTRRLVNETPAAATAAPHREAQPATASGFVAKKTHVRRVEAPAQPAPLQNPPLIAQAEKPASSRPKTVSAVHSQAEIPQMLQTAHTGRPVDVALLPIESQSTTDLWTSTAPRITLASKFDPPSSLPIPIEPAPEVPEFHESEVVAGTPLDLSTALAMVGGDHPAVGFAQWRVQEAYAQLERAEALWLPSLQAGFSHRVHNGSLQDVIGNRVNVNSSSFQSGFGAGAVGAGSNSRPGLVAQFHLSDAIFQPRIVERDSWARQYRANAVYNDQLLEVALAYLELLSAEQAVQIVRETQRNTEGLAKLTADYARAGQGLQSDADRLATELSLVRARLLRTRERSEVASARLAQALSADASQRYLPGDVTVLPIELVSHEYARESLIASGLSNRPELSEAQNLVASACEAYKRQRYSPFVPSVLLGFGQSSFAGAIGSDPGPAAGRMDWDAIVTWEIRNLGFGERAARNETNARIEQAKFEQVRTMDRVAREISEAYAQVERRRERIEVTQQAILTAEDSYARNLRRIRDGQGLPIEVLQSLQALEQARQAYLDAVIEFNQAQFRLQWSLGWPVSLERG